MRDLTSRRGFVVPTVLLLAAILSAAIAGAYTYLNAERRRNDSRQGEVEAVAIANAGLQNFLIDFFKTSGSAQKDSMMPANWIGIQVASDSSVTVRFTLDISDRSMRLKNGTGYYPDTAEVKAYLIRRPTSASDSSLWYVRSRGVAMRARAAGMPITTRSVGAFTWISPGSLNVLGSWVSLTGINRNGSAGVFSGVDACGQAPNVSALVAPSDISPKISGNVTAGITPYVDTTKTSATLTNLMAVDWTRVSSGTSPVPDFTLTSTSQTLPLTACTRMVTDSTYYPVVLVQNGPSYGSWTYMLKNLCSSSLVNPQALLIVQGDLSTQGATSNYKGIILTGESFTANGNQVVQGAIISGLRRTVDSTYQIQSDVSALNGNKTYQYNSCSVKNALAQFRGLRPMRNTWSDGIPSN